MTQTNDPNDILMGGGGGRAWKFDEAGTTHEGTIASVAARQVREYDKNNPGGGPLKFYPNSGDPIMGVVVELQTADREPFDVEDDGRRTFYMDGKYVKAAVKDAVLAAKANGLEVGAYLQVTFTHREDPQDKGSRKHWKATYTPAASNVLGIPAPAAWVAPAPAPAPAPEQAPAPANPLAGLTPDILAALAAMQAQQAAKPPF